MKDAKFLSEWEPHIIFLSLFHSSAVSPMQGLTSLHFMYEKGHVSLIVLYK
jgi:hypothetical protein